MIKILKKRDKAAAGHGNATTLKVRAELEGLPMVTNAGVDMLATKLENAYARGFCEGNVQVARATLQVRQASMDWTTLFGLGVRVGIMVCLLAWLLWDLLIDTAVLSGQDEEIRNPRVIHALLLQLPVYRFALAVSVGFFLWSGCLWSWSRARINYLFLLELDPEDALTPSAAATIATRQATLTLFALLLATKHLNGELRMHHAIAHLIRIASGDPCRAMVSRDIR